MPKVLLAEDDNAVRDMLRTSLERDGFEVVAVANVCEALSRIAPYCCWTRGRWPDIGREWNDIQNIARDVRLLSDQLARLDHAHSFAKVA